MKADMYMIFKFSPNEKLRNQKLRNENAESRKKLEESKCHLNHESW